MHILKKPDLSDPKMRATLAKGMGHNYYGEPAWPNDLLYIFPVVILGTIACIVGLAVLDPAMLADKADPFATPLEILPEWYLYPVFQILRVVPNKLLGIALQPNQDVDTDRRRKQNGGRRRVSRRELSFLVNAASDRGIVSDSDTVRGAGKRVHFGPVRCALDGP
jgi:hypothetical protein